MRQSSKYWFLFSVSSLLMGFTYSQNNWSRIQEPKNIRTIRIEVKESYGKADKVKLPFEEISKKILIYGNINVIDRNRNEYDATLMINVKGKALSDFYYPAIYGFSIGGKGQRSYSGAKIKGEIFFQQLQYKFSFEKKPPFSVYFIMSSPNQAPFREALNKSNFQTQLFEIVKNLKGLAPLISALNSDDFSIRSSAIEVLGKTNDPRAIEAFISTLKNSDYETRKLAIIDVLGKKNEQKAIMALVSTLEDSDYRIRKAAAEALKGNWKPPDDLFQIKYLIADMNWKRLVTIGSPAVDPLVASLKDQENQIRQNVAKTLLSIGDPKGIEALKSLDRSKYQIDFDEVFKSVIDDVNKELQSYEEDYSLKTMLIVNTFFVGLPIYDLQNRHKHGEFRNILGWSLLSLGVLRDIEWSISKIIKKPKIEKERLHKELEFLQTLKVEFEQPKNTQNKPF